MKSNFKHITVWESGWNMGYNFHLIELHNPISGEFTGWQAGYTTNMHGNAEVDFFANLSDAVDHLNKCFKQTGRQFKVNTKQLTKYQLQHDEDFRQKMVDLAGEELVNNLLNS